MDTAQWPQEIVVKPIEDIVATNSRSTYPKPTAASALEKKPTGPQKEEALNCPRCHSINTKFCYYNNYSLTQPRYFCKTCRRYWTEGGSLRNIPVGGGSRKNKRSSNSLSSSSSSPSNSTNKNLPDLVTLNPSNLSQNCTQNPKFHQGQDLNLAFPATNNMSASSSSTTSTTTTTTTTTINTTTQLSALELLTGITTSSSRGQHSFMPVQVPEADPNSTTVYSTCGFPLQDFKPTLNFSLDGINGGSGFANLHGTHVQETSTGRVLFPFEDLKQVSNSSTNPTMDQNNKEHHHHGYSTGYWTGMLGGGSW